MFRRLLRGVLNESDITEDTWEELEAVLIQADMGVEATIFLVDQLRDEADRQKIRKAELLIPALKKIMRGFLTDPPPFEIDSERQLTVVMVVGVNGSGKTTSIGKLAKHYSSEGRKVRIVAGDTFRAAAIDQIKEWSDRADVPITASEPGGDSAAIVHDGIRAARARGEDLVFVDTAGRLHTQFNLMRELEKISSICTKLVHEAPHETLIVLDAPTGQNALIQAKHFKESVDVSGVILTKLDGSSKGGMVFSVYRDLELPIRFIGTGEGLFDIQPFDPDTYINQLFD